MVFWCCVCVGDMCVWMLVAARYFHHDKLKSRSWLCAWANSLYASITHIFHRIVFILNSAQIYVDVFGKCVCYLERKPVNWSENNQNKRAAKKKKSVLSGTIIVAVVYRCSDGVPIPFCLCAGWKVNLFRCRGMDGVKKGTPQTPFICFISFPIAWTVYQDVREQLCSIIAMVFL